jgi:hypothetical protein
LKLKKPSIAMVYAMCSEFLSEQDVKNVCLTLMKYYTNYFNHINHTHKHKSYNEIFDIADEIFDIADENASDHDIFSGFASCKERYERIKNRNNNTIPNTWPEPMYIKTIF